MAVMVVRRPCVADYYYPSDPHLLTQRMDRFIGRVGVVQSVRAVVVPHGSLERSGAVVGSTLGHVRIPRRCILLGPSHTGSWVSWNVLASGAYRTPLGDVPIDESCAQALSARCPFLRSDGLGQMGEHAIEVQVPWLQRLGPPDLSIVPIIIGSATAEEIARMAEALAQVVRLQEEPVLLIASVDLSHYHPHHLTCQRDRRLIDAMAQLDTSALQQAMEADATATCGGVAAVCVVEAARRLGATGGMLVAYGTSAESGGDPGSAVGYAGMVIR